MIFQVKKQHKTFGGMTGFASHESSSTKTNMNFSYFLPSDIDAVDSAIIWLSGLTCTEENFITKAGAQKYLQNTKTMIICPDTSPRGLTIAGSEESYDFGVGASFYVNSTIEPYKANYQMEDYIVKDIVELLTDGFGVSKISICGHSMGGHGALTLGLKHPKLFQSISAFSPIVNPVNCPWGQKAFSGYLGENKEEWKSYDACEQLRVGKTHSNPILIHQGLADEFYEKQLLTHNILEAARLNQQEVILNEVEGYDHSYYFISSFIGEHIKFHTSHF